MIGLILFQIIQYLFQIQYTEGLCEGQLVFFIMGRPRGASRVPIVKNAQLGNLYTGVKIWLPILGRFFNAIFGKKLEKHPSKYRVRHLDLRYFNIE